MTMGQITVTPEELAASAVKYRSELLMASTHKLEKATQHMTLRRGVRYKEIVGAFKYDGELRPYTTEERNGSNASITGRTLETFLGQVWDQFDPNDLIKTIYGSDTVMGEGLKGVPVAKVLLTAIMRNVGQGLYLNLWKAKRNDSGKKTVDLFNGFDTITDTEITASALSADNGNYVQLSGEIDSTNAVDALQTIYFGAHDLLQEKQTKMFLPVEIFNAYNKCLKMEGGGIAYYKDYTQTYLEGSNGLCELVPLANKKDSKYIHLSTRKNMMVGVNQTIPGEEKIEIMRLHPVLLDFYVSLFFGCQFESLDPTDIYVAQLAASAQGGGTDGGEDDEETGA